jgi:hypothetical protein
VGATFELIGGFEVFFFEDDDVEDGISSMLFDLVASSIPKWRTFELMWWVQLLN